MIKDNYKLHERPYGFSDNRYKHYRNIIASDEEIKPVGTTEIKAESLLNVKIFKKIRFKEQQFKHNGFMGKDAAEILLR